MCFGYVLVLAHAGQPKLSMLDWGGGLGHYLLLAQTLSPGVEVDYHCKDVPLLVAEGKRMLPEATFYSDDSCLARRYDLVLASGSMHYDSDWRHVLSGLAAATVRYLFVTRLPVIHVAASYVFIQRPYRYGYNTEYLGWCLNRNEFLEEAGKVGLHLVREFVTGERPAIEGAPEQCEYRGYLFAPAALSGR
jgi:putative methyltransferase (TIGR04325 family)